MAVDVDVKSAWRERWLICINELADFRSQRATWLNAENSNPHYSYVEYVGSYFDDLNIDGWGGYQGLVDREILTAAEATAVAPLDRIFSNYSPPDDDSYDHEAILRDTAWIAVTREAETTRTLLLGLLTDPHERKMLTETSIYALEASRSEGSA